MRPEDFLPVVGAFLVAVGFVYVIWWRRKDHAVNTVELADSSVCEHLRPALEHVVASGCRVTRVGQNHPDLPLEIHFAPAFDPAAVYADLKLEPPVHLSDRNVLYCKDDWCELHPKP
jgi:hypothetical protein